MRQAAIAIQVLSFRRFGTLLVVTSIIFPILLSLTLIHPKPVSDLVESFTKINNVLAGRDQNSTTIEVKDAGGIENQNITGSAAACSLQHNLLPEFDVQKTTTSLLKKQTSKAVLVASLYSEYGEKLRTMYKEHATMTREVIKVYQPSHEGRQNSNYDTHNIKAWSEIYLLSLCDVLITSPNSTFGYVAHSLGGLKPWILRRPYGETIPNPPCQRAKSMDPCFHYPPKY